MEELLMRNKMYVDNSLYGEDEEQIGISMFPLYQDQIVHKATTSSSINHIYLCDDIVEPSAYVEYLKAFNTAREGDKFIIHINCWGGNAYTALQLIDSMCSSEAEIICLIEGACASAATMIALSCDAWRVSPFSCFMIHATTEGYYGKFNELKIEHEFNLKWTENLFNSIYEGFLTPEEIKQCLEGKDFWFDAKETEKRLKDRTVYIEKKFKEKENKKVKKLKKEDK